MGARALERSTDLTVIVDGVFGGVCTPTAPPAAVLWTFCRQPLGPSGVGWELHGDAWPDPAGTVRSTPVDVDLRVDEPRPDPLSAQLDAVLGHTSAGGAQPAKVIGPSEGLQQPEQPEEPTEPGDPTPPREVCIDLVRVLKEGAANPAMLGKLVRVTVLDFNAVPYPSLRISRGRLAARAGRRLPHRAVAGAALYAGLAHAGDLRGGVSGGRPGSERPPGGAHGHERAAGRGRDGASDRQGHRRVVIDAPSDETMLLRVCVVTDPRQLPGIVLEPDRAVLEVRGRLAMAAPQGKVDDCMRALALPERTEPQRQGQPRADPGAARPR